MRTHTALGHFLAGAGYRAKNMPTGEYSSSSRLRFAGSASPSLSATDYAALGARKDQLAFCAFCKNSYWTRVWMILERLGVGYGRKIQMADARSGVARSRVDEIGSQEFLNSVCTPLLLVFEPASFERDSDCNGSLFPKPLRSLPARNMPPMVRMFRNNITVPRKPIRLRTENSPALARDRRIHGLGPPRQDICVAGCRPGGESGNRRGLSEAGGTSHGGT